ncbi:MAG: glycosyltransferase [Anaerolineae bacterium]|nr:glycosyltransferase [Anaerolineae bacterium]
MPKLAKTRQLSILLISRCPPYPLHLGDRLIPYHIARELARRGHQIDLLAYYQQPEDLADIPAYEEYFHSVRLIREPARGPLTLLGRLLRPGWRFPRAAAESWSPEMWRAIEEQLRTHPGYDVVHLFGGVHVYEFRRLVEEHPNIIVPYESYSLLLERALASADTIRQQLVTRVQLALARRFESWMFAGYQRTVVVSAADAAALRAASPGLPVTVIPNGVDLDQFVPAGDKPETPTLIFTGNFDYAPNQDAAQVLIQHIFPQVKAAIPQAELLIVGNNPPSALRELAGAGVQVTGRVPDMCPYLDMAHVYVSPLRIGAGIKNKILEAMAMQLAVVGTPISFDGIRVADGQDAVIAEQPEAISRAVIRLLEDDGLRRQIAANARACIARAYTWQGAADAYEALYQQVMEDHDERT